MPITNLALNKLLHFLQGWNLALEGDRLIDADFEAWQYGPVVPLIYHQFKRYGGQAIRGRATKLDFATGRDLICTYTDDDVPAGFVDPVFDFYSAKTGITLSLMSHEDGAPWSRVRTDSPTTGMVISDGVIRAYFAARLARRRPSRDVH